MFEGGDEQTLAEPSGAAQEVDLASRDSLVDQVRLIYIDVTIVTDLFKTLDADRIFHSAVSFLC